MSEVGLECKLARNYTLENVPNALAYLLIKVIPDPSVNFGSLPINLGLIIDVSRSMRGKKIECARDAAKMVVDLLRPDDWVSVTVFSDEAKVIVPNTKALEKDSILSSLDKIRIVSGTRMYHGMEAGVREMHKVRIGSAINRMILLTDGMTEGEEQCCAIAGKEAENNISVSAFGIGDKYNEELLIEIADKTLGTFYHLGAPEQIIDQFQKEVGLASESVISDVKLSLNLVKDVELKEVHRIFPSTVKLQPKFEADERIGTVDVGNLRKDEQTCFGAQLRLPARTASRVRIAQVFLTYNIPSLQIEDRVVKSDVTVEYTNDRDLCGKVDREVVAYFNQLNVDKLIEQAIRETKVGNISAATQVLGQAQLITQRIGNVPLTKSIEQATQELKEKGTISSESIKTVRAGSSQTVRIEKTDMA
jgi:Ca-activated chloride channel family protein